MFYSRNSNMIISNTTSDLQEHKDTVVVFLFLKLSIVIKFLIICFVVSFYENTQKQHDINIKT